VPCSGSGTWGRTPEQLSFFQKNKIQEYADLQREIISNVVPHLAVDGYLLYITCSVFKKENEGNVQLIQQKFPSLQLIHQEILIGYDKKADTMFAALFKKG
jgi:16S rRNA (cytosine967-C5)-methyltransferase